MKKKKDAIYENLRQAIISGEYSPGERLLPEISFARKLGIGQITLRHALGRLEADGLIERIRSRGTFVREKIMRATYLLLLPDRDETPENPSRYIAMGVEETAEKNAVRLECCPMTIFAGFSPAEKQNLIRQNAISGIILETGHKKIPAALAEAIRALNIPTVIPHGTAYDAAETGFLVLRTGERSAFSQAYKYLAQNGHRRIATLFWKIEEEPADSMRGFSLVELREFLHYNQLDSDDELIAYITSAPAAVKERITGWMTSPHPPTAIMCHSDIAAMQVYACLKEMNIRIPDEVSVMGYSNYPGCQFLFPPLTTVDTQLKNCGRMALEKLCRSDEWFGKTEPPEEIFTPFRIISRSSVKTLAGKNSHLL